MPIPSDGHISIGDNSTRILSIEFQSDQQSGTTVIIKMEGEEDPIKTTHFEYARLGFQCNSYQHAGPVWRAEFRGALSEDQTGVAEVTDQWEFDSEFVQESIWVNPYVVALAGTDFILSVWKADIKQAIKDEKNYDEFVAQGFPAAENAIFLTVNRGQDAVEVRRINLRRVRTIPLSNTGQSVQDAVEKVYSTAALIGLVGIPDEISSRMPVTPSGALSLTAWAWKERRNASVLTPQIGKAQETREWTFAAWSTLTYQLVT